MNLRFLRTFITVADNAGVGRAATRLNLTQSAVSRQIQALEGELGLPLFAQIGRNVRLTSEGEDLLVRGRRLLFEAEAFGQRASALKTGEVGVLRVGATPQVIESLLADFLSRYRTRHSGVEIHLLEDGGSRLPLRLERGDIDVALMPAGEERYSGELLYPMHVLAVLPQGHRLSRRAVLDVTDLANEPLLRLGSGFASYAWFEAACQVAHIRPRVMVESVAPQTLIALARTGHGIAVVPSPVRISTRGCAGSGRVASRSFDRTVDSCCLGLAALQATLCRAIRRRTRRPLPPQLSGPRIQSSRTAATAAERGDRLIDNQ